MNIELMVDVLERFQTLIVGALGFVGIIATIATNAWLTRRHNAQQINHEGNMLRIALRSELEIIRDAFLDRISSIANAKPNHTSILVPLNTMTDTYGQLVGKIGLLSKDEVRATMNAYLLVRQMPERIKLLQRVQGIGVEKDSPFANIGSELFDAIRKMHENYLKDIEVALSALSSQQPDR